MRLCWNSLEWKTISQRYIQRSTPTYTIKINSYLRSTPTYTREKRSTPTYTREKPILWVIEDNGETNWSRWQFWLWTARVENTVKLRSLIYGRRFEQLLQNIRRGWPTKCIESCHMTSSKLGSKLYRKKKELIILIKILIWFCVV